jgi:hypothetical protein
MFARGFLDENFKLCAFRSTRPILSDDFVADRRHPGGLGLQLFRAVSDCAVDFFDNFSQTMPKFPARIVLLKFPNIADPPDVVADPVRLLIAPR